MASIIVVGGYGAVGSALAAHLVRNGHRVVIAGRRLDAAQAVAGRIGAEARHLDLADSQGWTAALAGIDLAVMGFDAPDTRFAAHLFERGIHYVELSAEDRQFRQIEAMPPPSRSAALLSVGFAPGLSNLMAKAVAGRAPAEVRIGLLFGMNDQHGDAALDWTIDAVLDQHDRQSARFDWGSGWGSRRMHRVDFGDQFALMRTEPGLSVATHVGLDSRLATSLTFALAPLAQGRPWARHLARRLFRPMGIGSDVSGILASPTAGGPSLRFIGHGETRTTAALAALMIEQFLASAVPPGIWHSHQVLSPDAVLAEVIHRGIGSVEWVGRTQSRELTRVASPTSRLRNES